MGAVGAVKKYIETMIKDCEPGYKIMLMDKETVSIHILIEYMKELQSWIS